MSEDNVDSVIVFTLVKNQGNLRMKNDFQSIEQFSFHFPIIIDIYFS